MADKLAAILAKTHSEVLIRHNELRGIGRPPEATTSPRDKPPGAL
jgi:hypothetical protein